MRFSLTFLPVLLLICGLASTPGAQANDLPRLTRSGQATQLMVDGKPYLMRAGELGNSSASSLEYMKPIWPKLDAMHLNALLTPVYWDLLEPREGEFDFSLLDGMIQQAREHHIKLVLLWFGSWKNSMSAYAPSWVKRDQVRFPRVKNREGISQEILSPFSANNLAADMAAYTALLKHLKQTDSSQHTVIMLQVENEIGMLPDARDYSPAANAAMQQNVPTPLISYMQQHKANLAPAIAKAWKSSQYKTRGDWNHVFGKSLATDEIFAAWFFARYVEKIAAAGKTIYPLPTYLNAALNRIGVAPGDYPSGGPLPHIMDIWKFGAPTIDMLSPDFYNPRFIHWNDLFSPADNPLFIPEIRFDENVGSKALFALSHYKAIGFSPFSIESTEQPENESLAHSYKLIHQLGSLITDAQASGKIDGVLLDKAHPEQQVTLGKYTFTIKHDYTLGWSPEAKHDIWPESGGLIIQTGEDEFLVAGTGLVVTFAMRDSAAAKATRVGIDSIYEGEFVDGKWQPGRSMNGDQSHQGRHLRIATGDWGIQKLKLYQYQ